MTARRWGDEELDDGTRPVAMRIGDVTLQGSLGVPLDARGLVVFAHGSGSGRGSPRNRLVARLLRDAGLATLLFDLLTDEEEATDARTRHLRFDIAFLAARLLGVTAWVDADAQIAPLPLGYFGASTGAAAALVAASRLPDRLDAVVSRGGRPDLAGPALRRVTAPTLLLVGGADEPVIALNREAMAQLRHAEKRLKIVPAATHLFEEPGALELVAAHAREWFLRHFAARETARRRRPPTPRRTLTTGTQVPFS